MIEKIIANALMAEEAIASTEIENGKMHPRDRFIVKMRIMFPECDDVWGDVYDMK